MRKNLSEKKTKSCEKKKKKKLFQKVYIHGQWNATLLFLPTTTKTPPNNPDRAMNPDQGYIRSSDAFLNHKRQMNTVKASQPAPTHSLVWQRIEVEVPVAGPDLRSASSRKTDRQGGYTADLDQERPAEAQ